MNLAVSKWEEKVVSFRSPKKCPALEIPLEIPWKSSLLEILEIPGNPVGTLVDSGCGVFRKLRAAHSGTVVGREVVNGISLDGPPAVGGSSFTLGDANDGD